MKYPVLFLALTVLCAGQVFASDEIQILEGREARGEVAHPHRQRVTDCQVTVDPGIATNMITVTVTSRSAPAVIKSISISRNNLPLQFGRFEAGLWHARYNPWSRILSAESRSYESGCRRLPGFTEESRCQPMVNPNPDSPVLWSTIKIKTNRTMTKIKWVKAALKIDDGGIWGENIANVECRL